MRLTIELFDGFGCHSIDQSAQITFRGGDVRQSFALGRFNGMVRNASLLGTVLRGLLVDR